VFAEIPSSPLAPDVAPVRLHYRDTGSGRPLVFLHSGWGYTIYPFGRQADALASRNRIVAFDRSGYGASPAIHALPADFHHRAVIETRAFLDALALDRPVLWGHSDGAIIALLFAMAAPDRIAGVIAEAAHFYKQKPSSAEFFAAVARDPRSVGVGAAALLADDHGERWADLIAMHSRTWLDIGAGARSPHEDFYGAGLADVRVPVLVLHGARDPRTEPGELAALTAALPRARVHVAESAGHSPHSERSTAAEVARVAREFIDACA
jgi:pimeloyl-ACP methyl ester carboxylesterase